MKRGIEPIRCGDLQVDHDVQRGFQKGKADKIAKDWDEDAVGVLVVSQRTDGSYWIIEGQHRWAGAKQRFGEEYPLVCEVHVGLTLEDEARMFIRINTLRSLPQPYDRFRVSVRAGYQAEMEISEALASLGLEAGPSAETSRVGCIEALKHIHKQNSKEGLRQVLMIAMAAFGREKTSYDADVLNAIAILLRNDPEINTKRLARALVRGKVSSPAAWKSAGQQMAKVGGSRSRGKPIARLMLEAYETTR